jgi:transposase InsO family protein
VTRVREEVREREGKAGSLEELCRLLGYTRQAYHKLRRREERKALETELVVKEVLTIREVQRRIGVRKLHYLLEPFVREQGIKLGRDQLNEILRDYGLLVRKRRPKKPRTTISCRYRRYPNLIKGFIPTAANQVWVSDITYVEIGSEYGFLSIVTDAYSRKIVGYKLSRDLSTKGCLAALRMALLDNKPDRQSLIHHSDRGTQYTSSAYVRTLGKTRISMTHNGDPLENAIAERINGILKNELLAEKLRTFKEAEDGIAQAVSTYNHLRPHLSIEMLTPVEAHAKTGQLKRLWKNYFPTPTQHVIAQA